MSKEARYTTLNKELSEEEMEEILKAFPGEIRCTLEGGFEFSFPQEYGLQTDKSLLEGKKFGWHSLCMHDSIPVFFDWTSNLLAAQYEWDRMDDLHVERLKNSRCLIPTKSRKKLRRCPGGYPCDRCPMGPKHIKTPGGTVSLTDEMMNQISDGDGEDWEDRVIEKTVLKEALEECEKKDSRITLAMKWRIDREKTEEEILLELKISKAYLYQLANRGFEICLKHLEE